MHRIPDSIQATTTPLVQRGLLWSTVFMVSRLRFIERCKEATNQNQFFFSIPVIHAKEDLKKKRKKFSSSKNISPVTESISISPETDKVRKTSNPSKVLKLFSLQALKRVSSYPACPSTETKEIAKPRRHEQTQSQHESVETTSEYTISSNELPLDPSSREPLLNAIIANH